MGRWDLQLARPHFAAQGGRASEPPVPELRLVFLGMRHPNPDIPAMRVAAQLQELSAGNLASRASTCSSTPAGCRTRSGPISCSMPTWP